MLIKERVFSHHTGEQLNNLQWRTVELLRNGKDTEVSLDGKPHYMHNDPDQTKGDLTLDSGVFVGGLPDYIGDRADDLVLQQVLGEFP